MYQFFVEDEQVIQQKIVITGTDVNHIVHVLRMKPGERIRISDASGKSYFCHVAELGAEEVLAEIDEVDEKGTELANRITLFQGLPKSDKMELIIQKAVELGVYEIVPVAMKNCVMKLEPKKVESKLKRWQAIAESAAKQSKRTVIPQILSPVSWREAVQQARELDITLVPYENERGMEATREVIRGIKSGQSIGIMIGPEGGFADAEIASLDAVEGIESAPKGMEQKDSEQKGMEQKDSEQKVLEQKDSEQRNSEPTNKFHKISLGRRILRTETAGLATLSMLVYELDE